MTDDMMERFRAALLSGINNLEAQRESSLRDLWRAALDLEHVILSDVLTQQEEQKVFAALTADRRRVCQEIFCALETQIENSFATMALGGGEAAILRPDSISENYLVRYERLARGEIALAGITSRDQVLFVGSGPLPITAIEYCRQTGCRVDCADFVTAAVETSRAVIERLGLGGSISCIQSRGEDLPAAAYSVILVGVLARPKQEIFDNIQATAPGGCRIIARTTFGLRQLIYEPAEVDESRVPKLRRTGTNEARGDQTLSSYLYVKVE